MDQAKINACFAGAYDEARDKFRTAATGAGRRAEVHTNPDQECPKGGKLTTDVARFGDRHASRVLFITSATHGVEGFCGSGVQMALMRFNQLETLPEDTAVVLIHAVNPYGFAWLSRTNEDNVDLNRNFVDFDAPLPGNPDYDEVHPFLLPDDWDGPARWESEEAMARYIAEHGMWTFQCAVSGGQYTYPDGLFYGGRAPTWSHQTVKSVIAEHASKASHVGLIDFHTGLGPYGYGEPITTGSDEQKDRARCWYGEDVTDPQAGSSTSAPIQGMLSGAFADAAPDAALATIALEFGTVPIPDVLGALRADNWLRFRGESDSGLARTIKRRTRDSFYCDFNDWRMMIVTRGLEVTRKAIKALEEEE